MRTDTTQTRTKFCSNCGEQIDIRAEICPHCGVRVALQSSTKKSPTTATILSFFVIGLGQVYNNEYQKALIMFVLAFVSLMFWSVSIGIITSLVIWLWSMGDAWKVAKETGWSTSASANPVNTVVGGIILLIFISVAIGAFVYVMEDVDEDTTTTPTSSPVKKPTPKATSYRVGDTISVSSHDITLLSADKETHYLSTSYGTEIHVPPPGQTFLKITVDVTNEKSSSVYVSYTDFNVEDSSGYRYDPYEEYIIYQGSDALGAIQEVGQGQKVKGSVMFFVPKNVEITKVNCDCGSIFRQKIVSWEL
ncbi:MAG: hypothetical protein C5S48_07125 [Candidatus Methanogaster sp.]|nr:MAG: hypothetical protein C5S48_07125 [ANME-2 cluster archaeon]